MLACRRDLGPVPDGALTTDATGYVAEWIVGTQPRLYQFPVITRFENRTAAPVLLGRCLPDSPQPRYAIVQADFSRVGPAYNPEWACVAHNKHFQLLPGAVRVDTFRIQGPNLFPSRVAIGGVFRLKLFVRTASGDAPTAGDSLGISNAFVVRRSK